MKAYVVASLRGPGGVARGCLLASAGAGGQLLLADPVIGVVRPPPTTSLTGVIGMPATVDDAFASPNQ